MERRRRRRGCPRGPGYWRRACKKKWGCGASCACAPGRQPCAAGRAATGSGGGGSGDSAAAQRSGEFRGGGRRSARGGGDVASCRVRGRDGGGTRAGGGGAWVWGQGGACAGRACRGQRPLPRYWWAGRCARSGGGEPHRRPRVSWRSGDLHRARTARLTGPAAGGAWCASLTRDQHRQCGRACAGAAASWPSA